MNSIIAEGKEKTVLKGNAQITSDQTLITADLIELYGKEFRYALSSGNVTVTDKTKGIVLKAQDLFFDRDKKISRVKGSAELEDQKNEMIVKGGYFENRDKDDIIIIEIGVRILKKDMSCRSEYAKYNRKADTMELSGLPVVTWKGDEYRANRIVVNVKTNEIQLDGRVSGKVSAQGDKKDQPAKDGAAEPKDSKDAPAAPVPTSPAKTDTPALPVPQSEADPKKAP